MLPAAPVTPDAETAREWAREELAKPIYSQGESWTDRIGQWISDFITELFTASGGPGLPLIAMLLLVVVIVAVALAIVAIVRPVLQERRRRGSTVMETDERTATQIRAAATAAAEKGEWAMAAMERYRAIVAGMEERAIIDERRGRTAYEAARDGGIALPTCADDLVAASGIFDEVCYGHREATRDDHDALSATDDRVHQATPTLHGASS